MNSPAPNVGPVDLAQLGLYSPELIGVFEMAFVGKKRATKRKRALTKAGKNRKKAIRTATRKATDAKQDIL